MSRINKIISLLSLICLLFTLPAVCTAENLSTDPSYYDVIEERNFFRPTKEGAPTPKNSSQFDLSDDNNSDSESVDDLILTGIIRIRGQYKAILEKKNEGQGFYVMEDDSVGEYTVSSIKRNKIILEKAGKRVTLKIKSTSNGKIRESKANTTPTTFNPPEVIELSEEEQKKNQEFMNNANILQSLRMGGAPNVQK